MHATDVAEMAISIGPDQSIHLQQSDQVYTYCHAICIPTSFLIILMCVCTVFRTSLSQQLVSKFTVTYTVGIGSQKICLMKLKRESLRIVIYKFCGSIDC